MGFWAVCLSRENGVNKRVHSHVMASGDQSIRAIVPVTVKAQPELMWDVKVGGKRWGDMTAKLQALNFAL